MGIESRTTNQASKHEADPSRPIPFTSYPSRPPFYSSNGYFNILCYTAKSSSRSSISMEDFNFSSTTPINIHKPTFLKNH